MELRSKDFEKMDKRYRANFFNTLSGFKSANLIGTTDDEGNSNLAIFNSVIHIGANPPLMGFILRPTTVERHTYENILTTRSFTFNHIHEDIVEAAHHSSAKYNRKISEFEKSGLTEQYIDDIIAPFVKESRIQMGLEYKSEHLIEENGTRLIIGQIQHISIDPELLTDTGHIDLFKAKTVAISGLDTYCKAIHFKQLAYARPKQ